MALNFKTTDSYIRAKNLLQEQNHNLNQREKELLLMHERLGHMGFKQLQALMRPTIFDDERPDIPPVFPTKEKGTANATHPTCSACKLVTQHRTGTKHSKTTMNPDNEMSIRGGTEDEELEPGYQVSTDQYICGTPGRLPNTYGKEPVASRYHGGTLSYDHASGYIWMNHQVSRYWQNY